MVNNREVILTYGMSQTVMEFLKQAAEFRTFEVIVAETAPGYEGHQMATELGKHGIETTVITGTTIVAASLYDDVML